MKPGRESWASSPASRAVMQANKRRDTKPELAVRRALHAMGLRYRVDARAIASLNRRADLVLTRVKIAVFIDGCFWHGCPVHGTTAKTNSEYWGPKIQRNQARDVETDMLLTAAGWRVLRFWEHQEVSHVVRIIASEYSRAIGA